MAVTIYIQDLDTSSVVFLFFVANISPKDSKALRVNKKLPNPFFDFLNINILDVLRNVLIVFVKAKTAI